MYKIEFGGYVRSMTRLLLASQQYGHHTWYVFRITKFFKFCAGLIDHYRKFIYFNVSKRHEAYICENVWGILSKHNFFFWFSWMCMHHVRINHCTHITWSCSIDDHLPKWLISKFNIERSNLVYVSFIRKKREKNWVLK